MLRLPCGHHRDEVTGPDNADRFSATVRVCWKCEASGRAQARRSESATKADAKHGLFTEIHDHGD